MDVILEKVSFYATTLVDLVMNFFTGLDNTLVQAGVLLGVALLVLIGVLAIVKKFFKVIIILVALAGVFYFAYSQGYLDGVLPL